MVRANRRYSYLVRNVETGETVQVGSTCTQDFTGWRGKPVFIDVDALEDELREYAGGLASAGDAYTPATVVEVAWAISRVHGWVQVSMSGWNRESTKSLVQSYLWGTANVDHTFREGMAAEVLAAAGMGRTIVDALIDGLDSDGDNVTNLRTCLRGLSVSWKHLGLVVSAVTAYERMIST